MSSWTDDFSMLRKSPWFWLITMLDGLLFPARAELPEWIENPPPGYLMAYVEGMGRSNTHGEAAMQQAMENGIRKIVESKCIHVDPSSFQYERIDSVIHIHSNLSFETGELDFASLQVVEEFLQRNGDQGYDAYVLIAYPNPQPRRPPALSFPVLESMLAPGWGHRSLGENRTGLRFLEVSCVLLAGTLVSYLTADEYHSMALKSRTAESIGFYNNRSRLFGKLAFGFAISYGLCGAYSVFDLTGSKYLRIYL